MNTHDYNLILRAIENCEDRERRTCQNYINLHPEDRNRIEHNRDMFLFATYMVRMELDRMIEGDRHA